LGGVTFILQHLTLVQTKHAKLNDSKDANPSDSAFLGGAG